MLPGLVKVSVKEATQTVHLWYKERQEVLRWQEARRKEAEQLGCVYTLLGRARRFPSMARASPSQRGHIERAAINTPVQVFFFLLCLPGCHVDILLYFVMDSDLHFPFIVYECITSVFLWVIEINVLFLQMIFREVQLMLPCVPCWK